MTNRPRYRLATGVVTVLSLAGCNAWYATTLPPAQLFEEQRPPRARITQIDGTRSVVAQPHVAHDQVFGIENRCREVVGQDGSELCVPSTDTIAVARLADVQIVEVRAQSASRTVAAVLVVPVLLYAIICSGEGNDGYGCP